MNDDFGEENEEKVSEKSIKLALEMAAQQVHTVSRPQTSSSL